MRIGNNIPAMTANRFLGLHQQKVANSVYRLSTGKRINSAADDPAGMAISQRLKAKIRELGVYIKRSELKQIELDTLYAEGAQRQDMLSRLYEIALQVSGDTLTQDEKSNLMLEYTAIAQELTETTKRQTGMDVVAITSGQYAGELMFKRGDMVYCNGQWAAYSDVVASSPGGGDEQPSSMSLIDFIAELMRRNISTQTGISAEVSALSFRLDRLYNEEANATEALSRIEDADFALELTELVKETFLTQCAILISAQANALPEHVLYLINQA